MKSVKVWFSLAHSQRHSSIWRGIAFVFLATIQTAVLFSCSKQPNSLYVSFQLGLLGQIWCLLVCFLLYWVQLSESFVFLFHNNDKTRTPPVDSSFTPFHCYDEDARPYEFVSVCESTHMLTHARVTEWLIRPTPGRREISHDAAERHSVWLTSEWGTARGLAGRRDASWHVAESVILRGRPGTQKKWSWYLPHTP